MTFSWPILAPIVLLTLSNIFMTTAWYGHLKFPHMTMWVAILVSWLIAGIEYCFAVPANRIGYQVWSAAELKTMQEVITLIVFVLFAVFVLGEKITLQHIFGFGLIALGACFIFNSPK
jgi:uncharacterized protein (DUF486 family)